MKKLLLFCIFAISCSAVVVSIAATATQARMTSDNYVIFGDVIGSGGRVDATSANYGLLDTIGEAIILSATSTSNNYGIKAGFQELYFDSFLTLTLGSASIDFGTLSASTVKTASHTMTVDTNAPSGYTVTASGNTLTSGANTITAIGGAGAASGVGTEQFGFNLVENTAPAVGANASGSAPIGAASAPFDTADSFAFDDTGSNSVASANSDVNETVYTVSYIANIANSTDNGTYTTTITFSATINP